MVEEYVVSTLTSITITVVVHGCRHCEQSEVQEVHEFVCTLAAYRNVEVNFQSCHRVAHHRSNVFACVSHELSTVVQF